MAIAQQSEHQRTRAVVSHPSSKDCSDVFIPAPETVCRDSVQNSPAMRKSTGFPAKTLSESCRHLGFVQLSLTSLLRMTV